MGTYFRFCVSTRQQRLWNMGDFEFNLIYYNNSTDLFFFFLQMSAKVIHFFNTQYNHVIDLVTLFEDAPRLTSCEMHFICFGKTKNVNMSTRLKKEKHNKSAITCLEKK